MRQVENSAPSDASKPIQPMQALMLMNDPQYVEAARHFAQRTLTEAEPGIRERLVWAFEQAIARPPTDHELAELRSAVEEFYQTYREDQDAAAEFISVGEGTPDRKWEPTELATWTMVANVIFNLDQFVTKE